MPTAELAELPAPGITEIPDFHSLLGQGEFNFGVVSVSGIALRDDVSKAQWLELTEQALNIYEYTGKRHAEILFKIGDLLRFGDEKFGEEYSQAIDDTRRYLSLQHKTLDNAMWVCGKIAPSIRRPETLTFSHHEAVCKLPQDEQDEYLRLADNEGLTVKELKAKIREAHPGKQRTSKPKTLCAIDVTSVTAITDALQIIANHLSNPETEWPEAWKEFTLVIEKGHRKHFRNIGHAKE